MRFFRIVGVMEDGTQIELGDMPTHEEALQVANQWHRTVKNTYTVEIWPTNTEDDDE